MILLRSGIGLRSYGQRDPLIEYKKEAFNMFSALMDSLGRQSVSLFMRAEIVQRQQVPETKVEKMETSHQEASAYNQAQQAGPTSKGPEHPSAGQPVQRDMDKVGRNDDCPCGSGRKYKKCCGK